MSNVIDLSGKVYGNLTIIRFSHFDALYKQYWICKCVCGTVKKIRYCHLKSGKTFSCGCHLTSLNKSRATHNEAHGTKEYKTWNSMKSRCNEDAQDRHLYFDRGIKVHEEWYHSYDAFLNHIGRAPTQQHSIDRINNDGNYEPGNVRWATKSEQMANRRLSINITHDGLTLSLIEWVKKFKIKYATALSRYRKGLSFEKIFYDKRLPKGSNIITHGGSYPY